MKTISVIFIFLFLVNGAFGATGNPDVLCTEIVDDLKDGCLGEKNEEEVFVSSLSLIIFHTSKFLLKVISIPDFFF